MFRVNEYSSGFEVEHIDSGQTHWMSDGVDVISCSRKRFPFASGHGDMIEALLVCGKVVLRYIEGGTLDDRYSGKTGDYVAGPLPSNLFKEICEWFAEAYGDDEMMSPGDPEFRQAWEDDLNADEQQTLEAYFPDIYAKQE